MGLPAHMPPEQLPDNRVLTPVAPADAMMQQIEELLGADAPTLACLEETLTEGYAQALALEAERWRLERRLGEMAREGGADVGEELQLLGKRLTNADSALVELRALLGSLHARARSARAAS
jgi:hypothetical protein